MTGQKDDEELLETLNKKSNTKKPYITAKTVQLHKMTPDTCKTYRSVGALNQTIARNEIIM